MPNITFSAVSNNLKNSFFLLLSTIAALCLFISPSLFSLLIIAFVFIIVLAAVLIGCAKPPLVSQRFLQSAAVLISTAIAIIGFDSFLNTWMPSSKVSSLANIMHLSVQSLLLIVGLIGCIAGFYALYTLSCWIILLAGHLFQKDLPEKKTDVILQNLKRNCFFPVSAAAFSILYATDDFPLAAAILIAFLLALIIAAQIPKLPFKNNIWHHIVSGCTTIGICLVSCDEICLYWNVLVKNQYIRMLAAAVAAYFIYVCVLLFWTELSRIVSENHIFTGISTLEGVVYGILMLASFLLVLYSFSRSEAFYGTQHEFDVIYTSDSPSLVKYNVYLALPHPQNDLRQPLFAVFSAPFIGLPYLIGRLFGASAAVQAILMNIPQVIMLYAANLMLAKAMNLTPIKRICFMVLSACTYTQLLFTLMMEQYIVAYFWLVFCIYLICEKQRPHRMVLWGAGGTLLTSMILLPFMSEKSPIRSFKAWLTDMVKYGLEFVVAMLVFCRFDVLYNLVSKVSFFGEFSGKTLTSADKLYQYTDFIISCFTAPNAGMNTTAVDHISWQLNTSAGINFAGVVILVLVIISVVLNRSRKISLLAGGWVAFSVILLFGLGWGTVENGLILYALYFGWAYLVLLFQLAETLEHKLKLTFFTPVLSIGCAAVLASVNIPAIMEMVDFAITHFPT